MTTPTFTPTDVVNFAIAKDSVNLSAAFDQLIGQRVVDAIQARKIEVANKTFNQQADDTLDAEESDVAPADEQQGAEAATDEVAAEVDTEQPAEQKTEESDEDAKVTS